MTIRFATEADAGALLDIYEQYIDTAVTFEYDKPSLEDFTGRVREISRDWPYLICEEDERVLGYAYAHHARERAAYNWFVELSVYLDRSCTRRGLGTKLYSLLLDILRLQGVKTAMGCVTMPNPASEALHTALGFQLIGRSVNAGYKNGAWHDVAWYELPLGDYDVPPVPVKPIGALDRAELTRLMEEYAHAGD